MTRARFSSLLLSSALATLLAAAPAMAPAAWAQSTAAPNPTSPQAPQGPATSPAPATGAPAAAAPVPAAPAPAAPAPAAPTPAPAPTTPAPTPAPASPATPAPGTGEAAPTSPPDTSISQTLDLPPRPAVTLSGKSSWDSGFTSISDAFAKLNAALVAAKITPDGHPLAVFTATDDNGFSFTAEVPLAKLPDGNPDLGPDIKLGETPSGKAMRFQHRGSYDEIDSTYEAITAYLDEKGLEARNLFAEEYLDQVKSPDDSNLQVDIYVFLK